MTPPPRPNREARLRYATPDFDVLEPGEFVRCAVTGKAIPLEHLTYWSVDLQEAYSAPEHMTARWVEANKAR